MRSDPKKPRPLSDFRVKATLGVAVAGLLFLTPFAINNFIQGRALLGVGSLAIVGVLAISAWGTHRGRYLPWLTFFALVPAIVFFLFVAYSRQGIIGALWCYPAVISFYFMLPERKAWLANTALLVVAVPQSWRVLPHPVAVRVAVTLFVVSTFSAIFIRIISGQQRRLREQAVTDPLTGLSNRMLLASALEQAAEEAMRSGKEMTLLALDLDHFKEINDGYGHEAGDAVLRGVGELVRERIRRGDMAFRLGGEEFLVLLRATGTDGGVRLAEALRGGIESNELLPGRVVTASIGVATLAPPEIWRKWMQRGDENLYRAKAAGRNRVVA